MVKNFINKYEIISTLGEGAMGVVYKVIDATTGKAYALKTIPKVDLSKTKGEELYARLRNEAEAAFQLVHPNIVQVIEYGEHEDIPFFVMEYVRGTTLDVFIEQKRAFSVGEVLDIVFQVLQGLTVAHRHNIIHRDLKPSNIILLEDFTAKIMDFGVAKIPGFSSTLKGFLVGTPSYMSPEQINEEQIDTRSDLFSVGVILYELLTGINPFYDEAKTRTVFRLSDFNPPPPSRLNNQISTVLDDVVLKALAKNRTERFQTAEEFSQAILDAATYVG